MKSISILGIYVADLVFFADRIPVKGETVLGQEHVIGPGGKGSNQAVGIAKAGGNVNFISKIGDDQFGQMALQMYKESEVNADNVIVSKDYATGAAGIFVDNATGENAIIVVPGAAGKITKEDIDKASIAIKQSSIFLTQLEAPVKVVEHAIEIAKSNGVKTILNPAPAAKLDHKIFSQIDYFTPNETEASFYVNHKVETEQDAEQAANLLLEKGIKNIIITLGEKGAYYASSKESFLVNAFDLKSKVVDTTGAGDAFNAGLAVALTEGKEIKEAIQFANAVGALSATKIGTAKSMPLRSEIEHLLQLL